MKSRRDKLIENLETHKVGAMVISSGENRRYLSGFTGSNGWIVLTPKESVLITDGRYWTQVQEQCPDLPLVKFRTEEHVWLGKAAVQWLKEHGVTGPVGIEGRDVVTNDYFKLQQEAHETGLDVQWTPLTDVVEALRQVKSDREREAMEEAARVADRAFRKALETFKAGIRERDFCIELEYQMVKLGARKPSFDSIVASGPNGAYPHAGVTDRVINPGELVTVDFGVLLNGYCSDITRTIWVGSLNEESEKVYTTVCEAQKRALGHLKAGRLAKEVDLQARDYIASQGFGEYFNHGLGHGIGLAVHEAPSVRQTTETPLEKGMMITVEPGVYIPGKTGCRIEDTVLVTENGFEYITRSPYQVVGHAHPLESEGF